MYFNDGNTTYWRALGTATISTESKYNNPYGGGKCFKFVGAADLDRFLNSIAANFSVTSGTVYTLSLRLS